MTGIIAEHNALNGYRFTIAEFGGVGIALGLLVAYYVAAGRVIDALAWFGLVVNCVPIAMLARLALRDGATDPGWLPLRRKSFRAATAESHPRLGTHTLVLVTVFCVPYLLVAVVLYETAAARRPTRTARRDDLHA